MLLPPTMHDASTPPREMTIQEYLSRIPDDWEWAHREAARCRDLTTDERFDLLENLLRLMQELLVGRQPARDTVPFWRYWSDPALGRPS
jgi:hypothetical protein